MAEGRIEVDAGTGESLCEIRDRVAVITLNRPDARNALSDHLRRRCGAQAAHLDGRIGGGEKADDCRTSRTGGGRGDGACARLRYPHCRRIRHHVHGIRPHRANRGLWHRVDADPARRNIASAGADVPVRADRRSPLRDAGSRQPRGA